ERYNDHYESAAGSDRVPERPYAWQYQQSPESMYRSVDGRTPSDGYGFVGFALPNSKFYVQELISPGNKGTRIVCGCTKSVNHNTEWVKRRETGDGRRIFLIPQKSPTITGRAFRV